LDIKAQDQGQAINLARGPHCEDCVLQRGVPSSLIVK